MTAMSDEIYVHVHNSIDGGFLDDEDKRFDEDGSVVPPKIGESVVHPGSSRENGYDHGKTNTWAVSRLSMGVNGGSAVVMGSSMKIEAAMLLARALNEARGIVPEPGSQLGRVRYFQEQLANEVDRLNRRHAEDVERVQDGLKRLESMERSLEEGKKEFGSPYFAYRTTLDPYYRPPKGIGMLGRMHSVNDALGQVDSHGGTP
ncbi:hypothetical protein SEA_SKOG_119 [Gordonia phage Skog]|uniref:Uncharacterized protein n=1 Tax=Gordonia phage Skog TaxID=2704033 RepID=A0A6G6XJI5_9CAUD|nr:hypothetical protein KHQ85_gp119 [Gordonia phage Skog]QIG58271.1 hypothetical protein SEA_SKOG_119 [Gordonia phage Skog]